MGFKKAVGKPSMLKAMFFGKEGSGKSYTALLLAEGLVRNGGRIAYVDVESGSNEYSKLRPHDKIHPKPFDFDVLETKSLAEAFESVEALDPKEHKVVIVDQLSYFNRHIQDLHRAKTGKEQIEIWEWGKVKRPYKQFVNMLLESNLHVIFIAREKIDFANVDGQMVYKGVKPDCDGDTPYDCKLLVRMIYERDERNPTKGSHMMHCWKDRFSTISGTITHSPRYETFVPHIDLLGESHGKTESEAEGLEKDLDAMTAQEAEEEKAEALREEVRLRYETMLLTVSDAKEMEKLGKEIKNSKKMRKAQKELLRQPFLKAQERIVARNAQD